MSFLNLSEIDYHVGEKPLLDNITFNFAAKERYALVGRNGAGKSTLMKILAKITHPESGKLLIAKELKIAYLPQKLPELSATSVYDYVAGGLSQISEVLIEYHKLSHNLSDSPQDLARLNELQHKIEQADGWNLQNQIDQIIQELELPEDAKLRELSGGWRRKVAIARALVMGPDLLLMDEPTNHLDLPAIKWLEKTLLNFPGTIIFVTHDRALLRKVATKILELDRGQLTEYPADYDQYLTRKQHALEVEFAQNKEFDKKLAKEEVWIRQGIKARRTRNEGRVRALQKLREERSSRREVTKGPNFAAGEVTKSGRTLLQAENVTFGFGDKPIVKNFSFNVQRGDKIALVGPNGAGKTTLVKLLLGKLTPYSGKIKQSPTLELAWFDQNRGDLSLDESAADNIAEGDNFVEFQGRRQHVFGYLGAFLFSPEKCLTKVRNLSGGEQNRLMLAKLFAKPANFLVLDEPTNDLDIESLEVLEDLLLNYTGTVLVVSHDREFISNIATHSFCFDANHPGVVTIDVGGTIPDFVAIGKKEQTQSKVKPNPEPEVKQAPSKAAKPKKLGFKEQRELEMLPKEIENTENEISALQDEMQHPDFFQKNPQEAAQKTKKLADLEQELGKLYQRWDDLEG